MAVKQQPIALSKEVIDLLVEALFKQNMTKEIVASMIHDLEQRIDRVDEEKLKKLSLLYNRLDSFGC